MSSPRARAYVRPLIRVVASSAHTPRAGRGQSMRNDDDMTQTGTESSPSTLAPPDDDDVAYEDCAAWGDCNGTNSALAPLSEPTLRNSTRMPPHTGHRPDMTSARMLKRMV